jgi:hypothetical protein
MRALWVNHEGNTIARRLAAQPGRVGNQTLAGGVFMILSNCRRGQEI